MTHRQRQWLQTDIRTLELARTKLALRDWLRGRIQRVYDRQGIDSGTPVWQALDELRRRAWKLKEEPST